MTKPIRIIAGNWKMNSSPSEAVEYFIQIASLVQGQNKNQKQVIFPPTYCLNSDVKSAAEKAGFELGAQNVHWEEKGAFTAENSAAVLRKIGFNWTLIAHSERRQYFAETNETAAKRLKAALKSGMNVIFCIGETLSERESGKMFEVLKKQTLAALTIISESKPQEGQIFSIAYEPVWAIGTGKTATTAQAVEAHSFIRKTVSEILGSEFSQNLSILYGGSVTADNAKELLSQTEINGVLVGGASLKPEVFSKIIS